MEKSERQKVIADLRKHHEDILPTGAYFSAKFPHIPEGMEGKHIGLYPSECSKGDNVFIECVNMSYEPLDASRRLYVWNHNPHYADAYKTKKEQFLIPVSELHVVNKNWNCKLPVEGKVFTDDIPFSELSVMDFFAIIHRTPISNKKFINNLINQYNGAK